MQNVYSKIVLIASLALCAARTGYAQQDTLAQAHAADTSISGLYWLLGSIGVHPAVQAKRAEVLAAAHRIPVASSLPNPMLMLAAQNVPTNNFSFSDEPMTSKMIGISQAFPFPGKLAAQAEAQAQDTVTIGTELTEKENELSRDIKTAYFEIYHLKRSIAVNQYHVTTMDEMLKAQQVDLTTGRSTQAETLDMELERADIATEVVEEQTKLAEEKAELERATGKTLGDLPVPGSLALPQLHYSLAELDTLAAHHRSLLAGFRSRAQRESLEAQRAELDKYPDFEVSLDYMQRQALSATSPMNPTNSAAAQAMGISAIPMTQSDMVTAGLSIDLPFYYGNQGNESISEDEALRTMDLEEERSMELDIHAALKSALAQLDGIRNEYDLLRNEIYPEVKMSLATSNANYTYGKAMIGDVLRDELALIHREHDRYRLEAEYNETLATIEYLTGTSLVRYSTDNDWK